MKKIIIIIGSILLLILLTACPGLQDWKYDLPNGYLVSHANPESIGIVYRPSDGIGDGPATVSKQVVAFCHNERYVGAQQITVDDYDAYYDDKEVDINYYIIDTIEQDVSGPFATEDEYLDALKDMGVEDLDEWIATYPPPDDAQFPSFP